MVTSFPFVLSAAHSQLNAQVPASNPHREDESRQDVLGPAEDQRQIQHTHLYRDTVHGSDCVPEPAGRKVACMW